MVLDLIWPSFPDQKGLGPRIVLEHGVNEQATVQTCMETNFQLLYFLYLQAYTLPWLVVVVCCFFLGNTYNNKVASQIYIVQYNKLATVATNL